MTTANTSIPITKMVNDLFLQWLSLPDTRTTLSSALHAVRTNSKMPEPIIYSKVNRSMMLNGKIKFDFLKIYSTRGGFSKSQHFDSPPVSPVPRLPSSPRVNSSGNFSLGENTPGSSSYHEEKKPRSSKKTSIVVNGNTTPSLEQQQVS